MVIAASWCLNASSGHVKQQVAQVDLQNLWCVLMRKTVLADGKYFMAWISSLPIYTIWILLTMDTGLLLWLGYIIHWATDKIFQFIMIHPTNGTSSWCPFTVIEVFVMVLFTNPPTTLFAWTAYSWRLFGTTNVFVMVPLQNLKTHNAFCLTSWITLVWTMTPLVTTALKRK